MSNTGLVPVLQTVKVAILRVPTTPKNPTGFVVDRDPFEVSRKQDTTRLQVEWICSWSGFTIKFKHESPFGQAEFSRPTPGSILSGTVRDGVPSDDPQLPISSRKNYLQGRKTKIARRRLKIDQVVRSAS
jgi:hypothetical protein